MPAIMLLNLFIKYQQLGVIELVLHSMIFVAISIEISR